MILRKPYAFFIKMFKPIHLAIAALIGFLMYKESGIFSFLNDNIYTSVNYTGQNLKAQYVTSSLYYIPIILIVVFIGILTIMFTRKKPITFYIVSISCMIAILVINAYTVNFFDLLDTSIVSVKSIKLIHDLVFISMFIEGVLIVFTIIRGAGVDIRKFNFDSDISKIDIKETDNEEFEVNLRLNIDKTRREKNKRIRYLKYAYAENKLKINIAIVVIILVVGITTVFLISKRDKIYSENEDVYTATSGINVENSYIVNESFEGNKITDNYLVVVNAKVKLNYEDSTVFFRDFNLSIKNAVYTPTTIYNKYLIDLGTGFNEKNVSLEYANYLFVYEIPQKSINSKMIFTYNDGDKITQIKLNPIGADSSENVILKQIGDELAFDDKLKGISFKINEIDIQDRFTLKYDYCINANDCINSKEYVKPSIDEDYDKTLIKLNLEYKNDSELKLSKFYNLLTNFGYIEYKLNDKTKTQSKVELVISTKTSEKNIVYLGVIKEIKNAQEINFVFNIRGKKYIYKIK